MHSSHFRSKPDVCLPQEQAHGNAHDDGIAGCTNRAAGRLQFSCVYSESGPFVPSRPVFLSGDDFDRVLTLRISSTIAGPQIKAFRT